MNVPTASSLRTGEGGCVAELDQHAVDGQIRAASRPTSLIDGDSRCRYSSRGQLALRRAEAGPSR